MPIRMAEKEVKTFQEIAKEIFKNSGNNLHYRVVNYLRDEGWEVDVSPFYNDNFSQKPREIDLVATKVYPPALNSIRESAVIVRLFIECKYIASTTVFWLDSRDKKQAEEVIRSTRSFHDPSQNILVEQEHHYLSTQKIAKLFESNSKKEAEGEPMFKAITQSINSFIYFRDRPSDLLNEVNKEYNSTALLNYPVIICDSFDKFFGKLVSSSSEVAQIDNPFQIEVRYAYQVKDFSQDETFYIDVLPEQKLREFISAYLSGDIQLASQKASDDRINKSRSEQVSFDNPAI